MLPVTPRTSSLPARLIRRLGSGLGRVLFLHTEPHTALCDLFERHTGGLGVLLRLDLVLRAAVELARAFGRQDDEQITVGHLFQRLLQRGKRHHSGTSTSGNFRVRRLVRQRSAWMIVASWSTASFTSRLMIR